MVVVIDHNHFGYKWVRKNMFSGRHNGAYYYSMEIVKNIIPNVNTKRNWITINIPNIGVDYAVVFIHNNLSAGQYEWLKKYKNLVLVCGVPETCEKVKHLGCPVYLPLSVEVEDVKQYASEKTKDVAFVGRSAKTRGHIFPKGTDFICEVSREVMLQEMARYRKVYAVGRCAIEAKILGCEVLPYDERFPDPSIWKVRDNLEVVPILQKALDKIDGGRK